jgi:antirestriction protein ArdC
MDLALEWGLEIKGIPGNSIVLGYFRENCEIAIASPEEIVFFHELAHAAHSRLKGGISSEKKWKKEVVAELSASILCQLYGKTDRYIGNNFRYIESYAREAKMSAYMACINVMKETEQVLNLIVNWHSENNVNDQKALVG